MSLPGDHDRRHGAAAEDADRLTSASSACSPSPADRWAACRRSNGRSPIPDRVVSAIPIATTARHSAQQIAFNEVGRQAIMADPDWNEGNYYDKQPPGARPGGGAHGGPHHLHERRVHAREVRPPPARQGELQLRLRRGFRSGELPALSRQPVRRPLRRQLVPLHHQGHGLLRPDQRQRLAGRRAREDAGALPGDQLQFGLAVPQLPVAGDRARAARAQSRRGVRASCSRTTATIPSWWTWRSRPNWCADSWPARSRKLQ